MRLSQKYIEKAFGVNWQDEYYIWDCCAGTGNLLNGLCNPYRVWASTLDKPDVDVMKDRAKQSAALLESHVFQFDFLNDNLNKLPQDLLQIINNPIERKKLIIYINPPYKEATNAKEVTGTGKNITGLTKGTDSYESALPQIGLAAREIYALFYLRILKEIKGCILASFSTLKILQAQNFTKFRRIFNAQLISLFIVPAKTFDNVAGEFPIGFFIWNLSSNNTFTEIVADIYNHKGIFIGEKQINSIEKNKTISDWLKTIHDKGNDEKIGFLTMNGSDIQHNRYTSISNSITENTKVKHLYTDITPENIKEICTYYTIKDVIANNWQNNKDQYLYPEDSYKEDEDFKNDCLAYTLFKNNVSASNGTNHWIPFTEKEIQPKSLFQSHFMTDYIEGKIEKKSNVITKYNEKYPKIFFSEEAKNVFEAGKQLWSYYHKQENANPNAGLYDIKIFFKGTSNVWSEKENRFVSRMNISANDKTFEQLNENLTLSLNILAEKIREKIYEHGFLS